jgi:TIR domain
VTQRGGEEQVPGARSGTPDVFISYASPDSAVADAACESLERAGVTCWIAPRDVTPGAFYADEIVHAIDAAKAIVLILSQHAAESPHVLREIERATSKRHPVVSLRVDHAHQRQIKGIRYADNRFADHRMIGRPDDSRRSSRAGTVWRRAGSYSTARGSRDSRIDRT